MRILFGCEYYAPSVGGVQEVIKQIAERLVLRGHDVTVVTTKLPTRNFSELNGVKIKEFNITGNSARGMTGELDTYRNFVVSEKFDVIMIKAAQQWTFDALWPVLREVKAGKVFIPCGFSGLYQPVFADYFRRMPDILRQFSHLIFYASDYRDINFVKEQDIKEYSIIPNGASEIEFSVTEDISFRKRYGIATDNQLFLTVGSFTGLKGHLEVVNAFEQAELDGPATLILNGNEVIDPDDTSLKSTIKKYVRNGLREIGVLKKTKDQILEKAHLINKKQGMKKVLVTDLPRAELVQAFMAADLFVFASNIEYSPLVLFEAAAAGTAFLSVPVGNAEEIAQWIGGGEICPAPQDKNGYTRVNPRILAKHMSRLAKDRNRLRQLGATGRKKWAEKYTWDKITLQYEKIFNDILNAQ